MTRALLTVVALLGFGAGPSNTPKAPNCAVVSENDIGKLPLTLTVGDVKVDFLGWKTRDLDLTQNEAVGFSIAASGPLTWVAESGAERGFEGSGTEFLDELALVKKSAPTLSRITFCDHR